MRLGVSTDFGTHSARGWADANASLGLKSAVFPLNSSCDDGLIEEYCKAAGEADIMIAEVGIWRNAIAEDREEELRNLKYSIDQLALADRIGARCCVNVAGAYSGARWDGPAASNFSKEARQKTVRMIRTVIDEVKPRNTFFTIEPMPWMVPTGPEDYLQLIEEVDRDRFGVHMDVINMINCPERFFFPEEFLAKTFELLKGRIRSCHLKDVALRSEFTFMLEECACGEGTFPLEKYCELINNEDPEMPVIIEHLGSDEAYRDSVKYVSKRMAADIQSR